MVNKILLSKMVLVGLLSYFFIVVEISLLSVLLTLYVIVPIWDFVAYNILFLGLYVVFIYLILNSRAFRLYLSIILFFVPGLILIFFAAIYQYSTLDFFVVIIVVSSCLIAVFFASKLTKLKILRALLFGLFIAFLIVIFIVVLPGAFLFLKIELSIICFCAVIPLSYSLRFITRRTPSIAHFNTYAKYILVFCILISGSVLFLPIKYTTINPDTRPSIVFWTSASELPGNDTLDFCAQNDIGFAVVLKESYISDGGASEYADIKRALDRNVDIYVALGGSSDFYLTLNNADEFVDIFKAIRDWMNDNDIYDDKHFIAFLVDAESPTELIKDLSDYQFTDKAQYFINEISDENEKEVEAQESLSKLVELIHDDNKEIGIIKMLNSGDEFDSDNDYSLLLKDVYSLDIDWDFSVSMIYRTQPLPDIFDYMIEDLSKYEYSSDNELTYTDKSDVERYLIPTSTFYYKVAYEVSSTEVNVPKDSRYIFAGTFNKKFEDTSYITGKEYLDDIDICSHFGVDKVFLYDYSGFIARYSKAELQELVDHIKTEKSWHLNVPAYYLQKEVLYTVFAASFDRILYI